jgi:raffinose/stachyose/melibiose transport system permease protein
MRARLLAQGGLTLASAIALIPSVYMLVTALKSQDEYQADKTGLPDVVVLDHFRQILFDSPIFLWMANSFVLVLGAVSVSLVVSCLAAYAIARMEFVGRDSLLALSTALMAVPPVVLIVPLFVLYTRLGLISTYGGAILLYAGLITPFSVYLLVTFFRNLPQELFDAAVIDGAGHLQILLRVVLPLSLAPVLTLVIVNALFVWNDLLMAVIFLQDDAKKTVMAGIAVFQGRYNNQIPLTMAGMAVAAAPMLILYLAFQRHFVRGLMAGAIK